MFLRTQTHHLQVRLATSDADLRAVQRLRYDVFVREGGADGAHVDHDACLECDAYDTFADHLLLWDPQRPEGEQIVGTYRLMTMDHAARAGGFYSAGEYDLSQLLTYGKPVLELGRSCLDPAYRGGTALLHLWQGIGAYVAERDIATLFGVASFPGTDIARLAAPLSLLHHEHLTAPKLRAKAIGDGATAMDLIAPEALDRRAAMAQLPALIKSYLRLGGTVGEGAFVDQAFNTTDVCLILETHKMSARQRALYGGADVG